jgi:hypothetical protein
VEIGPGAVKFRALPGVKPVDGGDEETVDRPPQFGARLADGAGLAAIPALAMAKNVEAVAGQLGHSEFLHLLTANDDLIGMQIGAIGEVKDWLATADITHDDRHFQEFVDTTAVIP